MVRFQTLPYHTKLYTPSGRLAQVEYVLDGRVHVSYLDLGHLINEEGCFPIGLVCEADIVPKGTVAFEAGHKAKSRS